MQNKVPNLEIYGFRESITEGESREEIKKTVSGEQNRGETMLAFRESRGENEVKREKEIGRNERKGKKKKLKQEGSKIIF